MAGRCRVRGPGGGARDRSTPDGDDATGHPPQRRAHWTPARRGPRMAMQVTVKGKNVDVPERVRDQATRKLSKISRFDDRILTMDVEFSEERNPRVADQHRVEVTCTTKAHLIRAEASGTDPVSAIDRVVDRLERQVKKLKGRR